MYLLALDTFHSLVKWFWNGASSYQQSVQRYKIVSMMTNTDKYIDNKMAKVASKLHKSKEFGNYNNPKPLPDSLAALLMGDMRQ